MRRYQDVALRTAYLVAPEADAADAVQDAFVKAYAALSRFRAGRAAQAVAAPDRGQRGSQPAPVRVPACRPGRARRRGGTAATPWRTRPSGGPRRRDASTRSSRRWPAPRRGPRGDRRALPARPVRSGDGGDARPAARDGQVADIAGARSAADRRSRSWKAGRAMAERVLHRLPERELELTLRGLAPSIAWPAPGGVGRHTRPGRRGPGDDRVACRRPCPPAIATGARAGWVGSRIAGAPVVASGPARPGRWRCSRCSAWRRLPERSASVCPGCG